MFWDYVKSGYQQKNSLQVIINELDLNTDIMVQNYSIVNQELEILKDDLSIVEPAIKLNTNFSSFLIMNCPRVFKDNPELLTKMRKIERITTAINGIIESRENYRISNGAMSNFHTRLEKYDLSLKDYLEDLNSILPEFISNLNNYTGASSGK